MAKRAASTRARVAKISVSLDAADLSTLRRRARRLHGGNLSAALAEGVRRLKEEEGREALLAWLGDAAKPTADEREAVRREWRAGEASRNRRRRSA